MSFRKASSKMGGAFAAAREEAESGSGGFLDEAVSGEFQLTKAEQGIIGANQWEHIGFQFVCQVAGFEGRIFIHRCGLLVKNLVFLARDLAKMGVLEEEMDALEANFEKNIDAVLEALVARAPVVLANVRPQTKNPEFMNMRIKELVSDSDGEKDVSVSYAEEAPFKTDETPETAEEGATLEVGQAVALDEDGDVTGVVKEIKPGGQVRVKIDGKRKIETVDPESLWAMEE